jgi:Ca2+:H+ antiporter
VFSSNILQLKTHSHLYNAPSKHVPDRRESSPRNNPFQTLVRQATPVTVHALGNEVDGVKREADVNKKQEESDDEEEETPDLSIPATIITILASSVLIGLCADGMVDSIDALVQDSPLSKAFVGLILLPIIGNGEFSSWTMRYE